MKLFVAISNIGGGGAERVGVLLANGFANRGHEVFVVTDLSMPVNYQINDKVTILDMAYHGQNKFFKWLHVAVIIRKYVQQYQPEVVIGIMQLCSFVSKIACIGTNTCVVMTEHDSFERPASAPMSKFEHCCKFYLNKIYECVTVITQADKDYIGNRLKHVVVMPNPLLLAPVNAIPQKKRVILAAGRLDAWHYKGFDVLIKSFAKLLRGVNAEGQRVKCNSDDVACKIKREGWKLQIAGTGSEKSLNYLKQLCEENGVEDSVEFLGFRKDVEKLYQESSVFVLSSRYEGFGLVLIEAMSQGCACVACDYKGRQREIIAPLEKSEQCSKFFLHDASKASPRAERNVQCSNNKVELCETGILCEPDDVESLASGIQKMIEDDEYRESVRRNAIERSDYYSLDNTMDRWESLLLQLTKIETPC